MRLRKLKVNPDTPLDVLWRLLSRNSIFVVPVVSRDETLLGVVDEDDLLYRLVPDYREYFSEFFPNSPNMIDFEDRLSKEVQLTAGDVMNKKSIVVGHDQPIFSALARMMANHIRMLPVLDEQKRYLGMILEDDIILHLLTTHGKRIFSPHRASSRTIR